jgi:hypothetical protein
MKNFLLKNNWWFCFVLTYALSWSVWDLGDLLLHAGTNVVFQYFPMNTRVFESIRDEFTLIKTLVYILIAIILLIATKGTLVYKKETTIQ